jgi:hypothetical protein
MRRKRFSASNISDCARSEIGQSGIRESWNVMAHRNERFSASAAVRLHSGLSRLARLVHYVRGEPGLKTGLWMRIGWSGHRRGRRTC